MSCIDKTLWRGGLIKLPPGDYFTRGPWAAEGFVNLPIGSALSGAGDDLTRVSVQNPVRYANQKERPDMRILHVASRALISDLCLSGPSRDDGQFWLVTAGVRGVGQPFGIKIRRVQIRYMRGTVDRHPMDGLQHEAFGVSFNAGEGGHLVEDCIVSGEPNAYLSAYSGCDGAVAPVIFARCAAQCDAGYAAFTLYDNTIVLHGTSETFGYSIYNDTGSVNNALVEGGHFTSTRVAMGFVGQPGTIRQNIRARDAVFRVIGPGAVGLELVAKGNGAAFRNIDLVGCRFINESQAKFTLFSASVDPSLCASISFRDCILPSATVVNPRGVPFQLINCRYENGLPVTTLPAVS